MEPSASVRPTAQAAARAIDCGRDELEVGTGRKTARRRTNGTSPAVNCEVLPPPSALRFMKSHPQQASTFGEFIASAYDAYGRQKASWIVRLAVNARLVEFHGKRCWISQRSSE